MTQTPTPESQQAAERSKPDEVILPPDQRWEISDETREEIRKIEENIRYANFTAPFILVG